MFNKKTILITGGTGSFGNLFVKYIVKNYKPKKLIIYSRDELKQSVMRSNYPEAKYNFMRYFIGDVRDLDRLKLAIQDVDYVIHCAALKQVDAAEYNPMECIKTNVIGAENVVKATLNSKVKKVIALSTDKASDPINLYGATKLTSDKIFTSSNNLVGKKPLRFSVVRYGNVVGSRGSVIPTFQKIIKSNGKQIPITDKRMTRFWITLEQAVLFVIKAFERMQGGEIFVPKIPSIRIIDLAKAMAPNLKINYVGRRPGEKLHEKMCSSYESHLTLDFKNHYVITPSIKFSEKNINYKINKIKEKGRYVPEDFEYSSDKNNHFLSIKEIILMNTKLRILS